jgi:hypothetical protein
LTSSPWNRWPPMEVSRCRKTWKSFGAKYSNSRGFS